MPTISVIVPVYKVEKYIHRCVDSILGQTYTDFELILVDDGSPDNCGAICDEYAAKDSRVVVIHQENGGLSAARNAGIDWAFANSDSQWLSFIDSDDWVHPNYLKFLFQATIEHNVDCAICEADKVSELQEDKYYEGESILLAAEEAYSNYYEVTIVACAKLFKKKLFEYIRFPLGRLHEDAFTIYKILFEAGNIAICWDPIYFYFQNPDGIMNSRWTPKRLDEIEAHEEQISYLRGNKYPRALNREVQVYLRVLARHIVAARKTEEFVSYSKKIRNKLRRALVKYSRQHGFTIEGNEWVFENAFPQCMNFYWLCVAALKRFHGSN